MKLFEIMASSVLFMSLATVAWGQQRNPVGENAEYTLDNDSRRTSGMIRSGDMNATVEAHLPDREEGPAYATKVDYRFQVQFVGRQEGSSDMEVPAEYFTEEFLIELRETGRYESPDFKVEHLGYADARNLDGAFYPNCDKIRIYDIDTSARSGILDFARLMLAGGITVWSRDIEDLEIIGHIYPDVPVLGAVKLDVSGKYNGMRLKAGADYDSP